jgi:hypothetical protein
VKKEEIVQMDAKLKTQPEDIVSKALDGERLQNVLGFIGFLKENKLSLKWASETVCKVSYKSKLILTIRLPVSAYFMSVEKGAWQIHFEADTGNEPVISDEKLKGTIRDNIKRCDNCYSKCGRSADKAILGKDISSICHSSICWFVMKNPDAEAVEAAKEIVRVRKAAIESQEK